MSHEISITADGRAEAFYANAPAWHQLGTVVQGVQTSADAMRLAHLDWSVEKVPVEAKIQTVNGEIHKPTTKFATVRADTKDVLGVVGNVYRPLQNIEAFNFMDSLIYDGGLQYESAGALKNGAYVWMLAKFPNDYYITDDDVNRTYLLLVNSHDGSTKINILPTNVRVVCWNTMRFALNMEAKKFVIRHTSKMLGKIEDARETLGLLSNTQQQVNDILAGLAKKDVTQNKVTEFIETMFPLPIVDNKEVEGNIKTRCNRIRQKVQNNFDQMDTLATRGTVYGMFNALTQYADHQSQSKGKNEIDRAGNKFQSTFFGPGNDLKQKALSYVRSM